MGDSDRRVCFIDMLATSPRSAISIDAQILIFDLDLDILIDDWINPHAGKTGMPPCRTVIG